MDQLLINRIVEAALLASNQPLTLQQIENLFDEESPAPEGSISQAIQDLQNNCSERGVELVELASGYRFQVKQDVHLWVSRLWTERKTRYSRATLETLSLIAYKQPITRGEIEQVRGVAVSSGIIQALEEREWIRVIGHRDVPGRPALFGTTKLFLDYFGLKSLDELPPLSEIKEIAELNPSLSLPFDIPATKANENSENLDKQGKDKEDNLSESSEISEADKLSASENMSESDDLSELSEISESSGLSESNEISELENISASGNLSESSGFSENNELSESEKLSESNQNSENNAFSELESLSELENISESDALSDLRQLDKKEIENHLKLTPIAYTTSAEYPETPDTELPNSDLDPLEIHSETSENNAETDNSITNQLNASTEIHNNSDSPNNDDNNQTMSLSDSNSPAELAAITEIQTDSDISETETKNNAESRPSSPMEDENTHSPTATSQQSQPTNSNTQVDLTSIDRSTPDE